MKNLDNIAGDLFNKIRGRFPSVTIGDQDGNMTNVPVEARFFDFGFVEDGVELGKVSIGLDEKDGITVVVGKDIVENQAENVQTRWYNFLKELRTFAKKRLLNFDVRDINKSNLTKRDYKFLATNRPGENTMAESAMYGTNKTSYQRIGNARLAIKHSQPINVENSVSRVQKIGAIYIESPTGERFRYPFRHLSGARAMARHVSEGGNQYDEFGKYISGLSEEVAKLRKFNQYINRSSVMAESLAGYADIVKERVKVVKKEIQNLQKSSYYTEAVTNFVAQEAAEVPDDVAENWIDQLTIKQFNEELKDVFPYIYRLVSEATKALEVNPEDIISENSFISSEASSTGLKPGIDFNLASKEYKGYVLGEYDDSDDDRYATEWGIYKATGDGTYQEVSSVKDPEYNGKRSVSPFSRNVPYEEFKWTVDTFLDKPQEEIELESGFEEMMGQFGEAEVKEAYINTSKDAIAVLANLRKIGKSIERGQGTYDGNLAGEYVNDVYDVISWLQNNANTSDPKFKEVVGPVIELRKKAKSMEREPGSGQDASFGNAIVNTLYPLMQWIEMNAQGAKEGNAFTHAKMSGKKKSETDFAPGNDANLSPLSQAPEKPKTPIGEFILSYFDRETGRFPKGETAVLTAVQKEYGDQYVKPAAKFVKKVESIVMARKAEEIQNSPYPETEMIKQLAGM